MRTDTANEDVKLGIRRIWDSWNLREWQEGRLFKLKVERIVVERPLLLYRLPQSMLFHKKTS